jgi:predicted SAM-dependent methyltransferase
MMKLNFGCGDRFADGWVNIDFNTRHPSVRRCNLLKPWPFAGDSFDVVYSSHVLEHFTKTTGTFLIRECHRVLKPRGLVRIVVPDFENACREYLRVLDRLDTDPKAKGQHEWMLLELLDQLTRTQPSGLMEQFHLQAAKANDTGLLDYIASRTENVKRSVAPASFSARLKSLNVQKAGTILVKLYINGVKRLIPSSLRESVVDNTTIGEKHKWMYDRPCLKSLLESVGFSEVRFLTAFESAIAHFREDQLDVTTDGKPYKNASLYCEARKG